MTKYEFYYMKKLYPLTKFTLFTNNTAKFCVNFVKFFVVFFCNRRGDAQRLMV